MPLEPVFPTRKKSRTQSKLLRLPLSPSFLAVSLLLLLFDRESRNFIGYILFNSGVFLFISDFV